jgi:hydrogen peroxide-dependent heme synthase
MAQAVETYEGWYAFHDFRSIDWNQWRSLSSGEREEAVRELNEILKQYESVEENKQGSFALFAISGSKADLLFVHFRPTLEELTDVKNQFNKTRFAGVTTTPYSYISVVELGAYTIPPHVDPETDPSVQRRLKPMMPKSGYVCFYPMNKKRDGEDNWYMLSMEDRREMMKSHGMIGRSYAGKVRQIITGSVGLDDWEWGVTLFGEDPLQFKKLVYEMRFDEASARFGEFGPFYVGNYLTQEDLSALLLEGLNG